MSIRVDVHEFAEQAERDHQDDSDYLAGLILRDGIAYARSATEIHTDPFPQFWVLMENVFGRHRSLQWDWVQRRQAEMFQRATRSLL